MNGSENTHTVPFNRVARINGIKTNLERLSDAELENHMSYAHERIEGNVRDLEALGIESARRFAVGEELGEAAMAQVIQLHPDQGVLFPTDPAA